MLGTHTAPSIIVGVQLLPQTRNVVSRASASNDVVVVPTNVSEVGDLIDPPTIADSPRVKPSFREKMMHFAGGAQALRGRGEQVSKILIGKQCPCSENNLTCTKSKCGRSPPLLRFKGRN